MNRRNFIKAVNGSILSTVAFGYGRVQKPNNDNPNIIYILADDMGYGDVGALNKECKIPTPNLNKLAKNGMIFTDAHSGSAVCTPTRYGVLTGRYAWRTRLKSGVLAGYSPALIDEDRITVASFLKENGYNTGCIGKWHLGWNWATKSGYEYSDAWSENGDHVDYLKPVTKGPVDVGFDYFFGISASLDILPYVYLENDMIVAPPTKNCEKQDGYGFYRGGPIAKDFKHVDVMPTFTEKVLGFIKEQSKSSNPFFLYFPLSAPHTPIVPIKDFVGKSGIGPYGDFVMQCDWTVGEIVKTLKKKDIFENTLIVFTSDNGCSPMANFEHLAENGHDPSYVHRGYKADIYEGGHRIPFIVNWPQKIKSGSVSNQTICLTDLLATVADIVGTNIPDNCGEDSDSILPLFLGEQRIQNREGIVHHSINGSFSIRKDKWKLNMCPGSGGWSDPVPGKAKTDGSPKLQLFDFDKDIEEKVNIVDQYPRIVHEMITLLEKYVKDGRSTLGQKQPNDREVDIWEPTLPQEGNLKPNKVKHSAINMKVNNLNNSVIKFADNGLGTLTNGFRGSINFKDGHWVGIEENDLDIILDLEKNRDIKKFKIGFLEDQNSGIFFPSKIEFFISKDGIKYNSIKIIVNELTQNPVQTVTDFGFSKKDIEARYIKVIAKNIKKCPKWHTSASGKSWVFIDEMMLY